jgi:alpha-ketoglutarate-dependent taurine dioxygenase
MVRTGYLKAGQTLPLVIEPAVEGLDPYSWAGRNRDFIEEQLVKHGAILFRGFAMGSTEDFDEFSRTILPHRVNYVEGSSPRISMGEKVYTSTEYPADQFVSMHNELSYAHKWPGKLLFFCETEPREGGETPIADSRKVLEAISPDIRERFIEKGVRYTRNLHGGRGAGLAWQTVFETDDKAAVEAYCREGEVAFDWKGSGGLSTEQHRPAVRHHPVTGEALWFNQADQWHPSNLPEEAQALLASRSTAELPIYATYGDGTPFEGPELDEIRRVFDKVMVRFSWRKGDGLLVDNMLVAHGRMPFAGPRRILVAMGETSLP